MLLKQVANRTRVESFVLSSSSLNSAQFIKVLQCFPGPMKRSVLDKLYSFKPTIPTQALPTVCHLIASRSLDSALPKFIVDQLEVSDTQHFSPKQTSQLLHSLAKLDPTSKKLFETIALNNFNDLSRFSGQDLADILWSLAVSETIEGKEEYSTRLVQEVKLRIGDFDSFGPTSFAKLVFSVNKLKVDNKREALKKCFVTFSQVEDFGQFSPQEFLQCLDSFALLVPYSENDRFWERIKKYFMEHKQVLANWSKEERDQLVSVLENAAGGNVEFAEKIKHRVSVFQQEEDESLRAKLTRLEAQIMTKQFFERLEAKQKETRAVSLDERYGSAFLQARLEGKKTWMLDSLLPPRVGKVQALQNQLNTE